MKPAAHSMTKNKYYIVTLFLISFIYTILNYIKFQDLNIYEFIEFKIILVLIFLETMYFFLSKKYKSENKIIKISSIITALIIILLNINLNNTMNQIKLENKILINYKLINCENIKAKFELDLKNNDLKYFSGGLFNSDKLTQNLNNFKIKNINQGCYINSNLSCYDKLIENYLQEKLNVKINDLY